MNATEIVQFIARANADAREAFTACVKGGSSEDAGIAACADAFNGLPFDLRGAVGATLAQDYGIDLSLPKSEAAAEQATAISEGLEIVPADEVATPEPEPPATVINEELEIVAVEEEAPVEEVIEAEPEETIAEPESVIEEAVEPEPEPKPKAAPKKKAAAKKGKK